jgi:PAS domain S-box-containing protein
MPGMNGFELAIKLNEERVTDRVPIIFVTANYIHEIDVSHGYDSGAVDYIFKPINRNIMISKVKVFLELFNQKQTIIREAKLLKRTTDELIWVNAALKRSETKYRSYIENAPDGVFVADENRRYIDVNEATCRMTGYSKEELLKMSFTDLLPDQLKKIGLTYFRTLVKKGVLKVDFPYKHKNGSKRWWALEAVTLTDTLFLFYIKDITLRKELEDSLLTYQNELEKQNKELERQNDEIKLAKNLAEVVSHKYTELYDFAPSGFFTLSYEKRIKELNHSGALMLGEERSRLAGRNFISFISDDSRPTFNSFFQDIQRRKEKQICEVVLKTDTIQPTYVHIEGLFDLNNEQILLNVIDISELKNIEKVLRESEEKFRAVTQSANDAIITANDSGIILTWNSGAEKIFGYKEKEIIGKNLATLMPESFASKHSKSFINQLNSRERYIIGKTTEFTGLHKSGNEFPLELSLSEWETTSGKFFTGIIRDITERKVAENILRYSESNLATAQRIAHIGSWEWDRNTKTIKLSKEMYNIFDIDAETFDGQSDSLLKVLHPDDVEPTISRISKSKSSGEKSLTFEFRILHKDNSIRNLFGEVRFEYDEGSTSGNIFGIVQDISERKLAEQTLKISEEKYRTIINASPDGILLIDLKGIITEVSEIGLEIFGANTKDDLVGKDFHRFVPTEEKDIIKDIFEKAMNEGLAQNIGIKLRKKNQSIFDAETSSTLIQGPDGTPLSFMIIIRDISQRKKTETKQLHADRMANLGEMASGIAHEINQPLNIISMVMDKILFETDKAKTIDIGFLKNKSDKIFDNIIRIKNIIDHVRAFSRNDDNYVLTAFNVNSSIENAISMVMEQFKHLDIHLKTHLDLHIPQLVGNTYKFEQVIVNLLTNAKDAVLERRHKQEVYCDLKVEIKTYQENQSLIVEIKDNGIGIEKDDIHNIMLPFYTTKEEGKGTGLGLSICYQIIKEMHGTIDISSDGINGTKIKLVLDIQNPN